MEVEVNMCPPTCLICNNYFDRKPLVNLNLTLTSDCGGDGGGGDAAAAASHGFRKRTTNTNVADRKFESAFTLFWKLMKGLGKAHFDEDEEALGEDQDGFESGQPCCGECYVALLELIKLEEAIKEIKARQQGLVEQLKKAVSINQDRRSQLNKGWLKVRQQLVDYVKAQDTEGGCDEENVIHYFSDNNYDDPIDSPEGDATLPDNPHSSFISLDRTDDDDDFQEPAVKRRRRRNKPEKIAPSNSKSVSAKKLELSSENLKRCSVSLKRLNMEDYPDLKIGGRVRGLQQNSSRPHPQTQYEVQPAIPLSGLESASATPSQAERIRGKGIFNKTAFGYITKEILIFICTPIKVTPNGFLCLEPNCTHFVEGSDHFTFKNMKEHVIQLHEKNITERIPRTCPICDKAFNRGNEMREHIFSKHTSAGKDFHGKFPVVCEMCWKTMPYYCHPLHAWNHRSEEEKAAAIASGEPLHSRVKRFIESKKKMKSPPLWCVTAPDTHNSNSNSVARVGSDVTLKKERCSKNSSDFFSRMGMDGIDELVTQVLNRKSESEKPSEKQKKLHKCRVFKKVFYPISNEVILFLCTPIRVASSGFTCLEPNCCHFVGGADYFTFENMKEHVIQCHARNYETSDVCRTCPICRNTSTNAVIFRRHILAEHTEVGDSKIVKRSVLCQSCWKDLPYCNYYTHIWRHKNKEEKAAAITNGPEEDLPQHVRTQLEHITKMVRNLESKRKSTRDDNDVNVTKVVQEKTIQRSRRGRSKKFGKETTPDGSESDAIVMDSDSDYQPGLDLDQQLPSRRKRKLSKKHIISADPVPDPGSDARPCDGDNNNDENLDEVKNKVKTMLLGIKYVKLKKRKPPKLPKSIPLKKTARKSIKNDPDSDTGSVSSDDLTSEDRPRRRRRRNRKKKKIEPKPELKFKHANLFFLLGKDVLFYRDVLVKFSQTEFVCLEKQCGARIPGSDYTTFEEFRKHVNAKKRGVDFIQEGRQSCPLCNVEFTGVAPFRDHIFNDHSPPPAICTSCWKPVDSYGDMKEHSKLHMSEEERRIMADLAMNKAKHQGVRYIGVGVYNTSQALQCSSCPKKFSKWFQLKLHEVVHLPRHLRPSFDCPDCGVQLLSKIALKSHIERTHRPDLIKRKRTCLICDRKFHYRDGDAYRRHMRGHTGERPFVCEACGKGFIAKENLTQHFNSVHSIARLFQCEQCEMSYKRLVHLKRHQRSAHNAPQVEMDDEKRYPPYSENRPGFIGPKRMYPCEHCGKFFQLRSRMTKHVTAAHPEVKVEVHSKVEVDPLLELLNE